MSSSVMNDGFSELMALRALSHTTGALHEAQVLQLKLWPRVIAPKAKDYEVKVDMNRKWVGVYYRFGMFHRPPSNFDIGCQNLNTWVKTLLGDEWMLEVFEYVSKQSWKTTFTGPRKIVDDDGTGSTGTSS